MLPDSLGNLVLLRHLALRQNKLTGQIPTSLGDLVNLQELYLYENSLEGGIPDSLWNLTALQIMYLYNNRLSGTISPLVSKLVLMQDLELNGNLLSGSIPGSIGSMTSLEYLYLAQNQFSGTIPPELGNLRALRQLQLGLNLLEGSIPLTLGNLDALTTLELFANRLSGAIPYSLRRLTSLTSLELQTNAFTGDFDLLDGTFFPPFVNVSANRLGPRMAPYPEALPPHQYALIDVSASQLERNADTTNAFDCPYPGNYPMSVALLRSPCRQRWTQIAAYIGIMVGSLIALALVAFAVRYVCSISVLKFSVAMWAVFRVVRLAALVLDLLTLSAILAYLNTTTDNCAAFNRYDVFQRTIAAFANQTVSSPSMLFDNWVSDSIAFVNGVETSDADVRDWLDRFALLCRTLDECDVDAATGRTCAQLYPQRSKSGGAQFVNFRIVVLAVLAVRVVLELVRIVCVAWAFWRVRSEQRASAGSTNAEVRASVAGRVSIRAHEPDLGVGEVGDADADTDSDTLAADVAANATVAELARSSFASPVLAFAYTHSSESATTGLMARSGGIDLFVRRAILRRDTPVDLLLRLCHAGLLSSIPLLVVNLYFLLRVTQLGMSASNWLALLNGFVLVPRLVGMAAWSWWQQRAALLRMVAEAISSTPAMPPSIELTPTTSALTSVNNEAINVVLAPSSSDRDAAH